MVRAFVWVVVLSGFLGQQPPSSEARVASVQVKGIKRYTPEEVRRLSGVEIGQAVTPADLTAAANRLAATGLFDTVRFTYTTNRAMAVTFEVTEASWAVPVVVDNFVWLPDEQLTAALRAEVPSYDGTAPMNQGAAEFIMYALEKVMKTRNIPGRIEFSPQAVLGRKEVKYLFTVKDPSPKLCALHFPGATAISEGDLIEPLKGAIGGDYSRFFISTAAEGTLTDMYRHKGFWRARFGTPAAALDACQGVAVTVPVTEGAAYAWDRAEWSGTQALTADALNKALGMKAGDVADGVKIDAGLRAVHQAYGYQGYIAEQARVEPRLDDSTHRAVFAVSVEEGPQFHMGTLAFVGIRDADAATLAKKWKLKPGDVYDESYEEKYLREEIFPLQTSAGGRGHFEPQIDAERHIVNARIVFK